MLTIITADQRAATPAKINVVLLGASGAGKTTQARTLPPERTLFVDLESGTLALAGWAGTILDVRKTASAMNAHPWEIARALAVYVGGPDPAAESNTPYGSGTYQQLFQMWGDPSQFKQDLVFIDSITVAGRWCLDWAAKQPEAFSEKSGKPDPRGAYGLMGREMIRWVTHWQHCQKSVVLCCILDEEVDELKRVSYTPQIDGSKTGRELPGIFDEVITIANLTAPHGAQYRGLVCTKLNQWGFPAKDRSGCLDMVEPPNLWAAINKIRAGKRVDNLDVGGPVMAPAAQ